jgi:hypothetical protein
LNLQIQNKKKIAQKNPTSQIEMEQLSKVNKTLSLKVKPKPKHNLKFKLKRSSKNYIKKI